MTHTKTQWSRAAGETVDTHGTHRSLRDSSGDERWLGQKDTQQSSGCRDRADMGVLGFVM